MTIVIDPTAQIFTDTPVAPQFPAGSKVIAAVNLLDLSIIPPTEDIGTYQIVFVTASKMSPTDMGNVVAQLNSDIARENEYIVAYVAAEETLMEVSVPSQVCIGSACIDIPPNLVCVPFTNLCFGGGMVLASAYRYTLWYMSRSGQVMPMTTGGMVRAQVIEIIAVGLVAIAIIITLVGVIQIVQGKLKWSDLTDFFQSMTPGDQISKVVHSTAVPLIAFGATIVLVGLFVPWLTSNAHANVRVPLGRGAGVEVGGGVGGGGGGGRRR